MDELVIQPSGGGVFEVTVDDELLFSKKATKRHAEYDEVLRSIRKKLGR
jgi:selT/selW/selH-like putative selenoprotein